jgi:hypothetical protein
MNYINQHRQPEHCILRFFRIFLPFLYPMSMFAKEMRTGFGMSGKVTARS